MRIGIEACTWANGRGYGRFTRGLISEMVRTFPEHEFVLLLDASTARDQRFPSGVRLEIVHTSESQLSAAGADGSRRPIDLLRMGRAVSRMRADVFLFPSNYSYFPVWGRTPVVTVFHDASAENFPALIFPRLIPRTLWRIKQQLALRQSQRIVTVSDDARRQIARAFDRDGTDIDVVSEGADAVFRELPGADDAGAVGRQARERYGLPPDETLVMYVGGISPHKNLDGLLRAMSLSDHARTPWHLALVGDYTRDNFLSAHADLVRLVKELGLEARVTFTGYVPDEDLVRLYGTATLFVLPSFSEGFGLPVLEAMACGVPVAVSNSSSLPEVAGDAGRLFDPASPPDIARVIEQVLGDASMRDAMRVRGIERARAYSWNAGARTMMRVLETAAARAPRALVAP